MSLGQSTEQRLQALQKKYGTKSLDDRLAALQDKYGTKKPNPFLQTLSAPGQMLEKGVSQLGENPLAGVANIGNAVVGTAALPFGLADTALRETGLTPVAEAIAAPFELVAGGVRKGEQLIGQGLDALGIPNPRNPEAEQAISTLNQGLAQFLLPAAAGKAMPKRVAPINVTREAAQKPTVEPITDPARLLEAPGKGGEQLSLSLGADFGFGKFGAEIASKIRELFNLREQTEISTGVPIPDAVQKITKAIKEVKPLRGQTERLYHQARRKQAGQLASTFEKPAGEATFQQALSALRGELPKQKYEAVRPRLEGSDVTSLFDMITEHQGLRPFEKVTTGKSLMNLLDGNKLPTRGELKLLEKVFGPELVKTILDKRPWHEKGWENFLDAINLPRVFMASFDMSAALRQGVVLTTGHPREALPALRDMHKYFFSEKALRALDADIEARPNKPIYEEFDLYLGQRHGEALKLAEREEAFMSKFKDRIPIFGKAIQASERAYLGYLNKLRVDVFDKMHEQYIKSGLTPENNPEVWQGLAGYINRATGRGSLKIGERVAPVLNGVFFSPRLISARLALLNPKYYKDLPAPVRKRAIRDMLSFVGAGVSLVSLAKLGGADVETDPRSSDFGKIRMGNTRVDPWGGFQQWVRFFTQFTTGQRKSLASGKMYDLAGKKYPFETRWDLLVRTTRMKFSPQLAILVNWADGKNVVGEEFGWDQDAFRSMIPLYVQDAVEATQEHGPAGFMLSAPGFYGMGIQTFKPKKKQFNPMNP